MLLDVLTDNPGSIEVEKAYLEPYRQGLKSRSFKRVPRGGSPPAIELPPIRRKSCSENNRTNASVKGSAAGLRLHGK